MIGAAAAAAAAAAVAASAAAASSVAAVRTLLSCHVTHGMCVPCFHCPLQ